MREAQQGPMVKEAHQVHHGDYDMQLKKIKYLAGPIEDEDAANKNYVDIISRYLKSEILKTNSDLNAKLDATKEELGNYIKKSIEDIMKYIDMNISNINLTLEKLIDVESITIKTSKSEDEKNE